MHALEKLGDGSKDEGYKDGEGERNQHDASEIKGAHDHHGNDYAEKAPQVFIRGVACHGQVFRAATAPERRYVALEQSLKFQLWFEGIGVAVRRAIQ